MRIWLLILGAVQLAIGLLMALAPATFFREVGPYPPRNDHYVRDMASWELALAAAAFLAATRPAWRVPVLTVALVHYALHAVNHVLDVSDAEPRWIGPLNLASGAAGAVVLAILLRRAAGADPPAERAR